MARTKDLIGIGMPAPLATREGFPASSAVTAAGTTIADATVLKRGQRVVSMTAGGSDGIRLPDDAELMVPYIVFAITSAGKVYPPLTAQLNGDTAEESQTVGAKLCAIFWRYDTLKWASICGAVPPA